MLSLLLYITSKFTHTIGVQILLYYIMTLKAKNEFQMNLKEAIVNLLKNELYGFKCVLPSL